MKTRSRTFINKDQQALTTVTQCRGGFFLPVKELPRTAPGWTLVVTENQWGKVTLKRCRLTQTHNNIRDAILANAELIRKAPDGRIAVLYSSGKVLREMGNKGKNHAWLYQKLEDMAMTLIEVETPNFKATGPMIQRVVQSKVGMGRTLPGKREKKEAHFQLVIFDPFVSYLFNVDIGLHYRELLPAIFDLRYGETQALVRFCLSHDKVNMAFADVLIALNAIKGKTTERAKRKIRKKIRDEREALERDFGITIREMEDGREGIFYKKHPLVRFESPNLDPQPLQEEKLIGNRCTTTNGHGLVPARPRFSTEIKANGHGLVPSQEFFKRTQEGAKNRPPSRGPVFFP